MSQVDVGQLERDRLRCPQPARVHQLEQGAVAQGGGRVARRLGEQSATSSRVSGLRQPPRLARRAQAGCGSVARRAPRRRRWRWNERRQAIRALHGGRRVPRSSRDERREVLGADRQRVAAAVAAARRRSARGRCGRRRACCARGRARTRGTRGSRGPGRRTASRARCLAALGVMVRGPSPTGSAGPRGPLPLSRSRGAVEQADQVFESRTSAISASRSASGCVDELDPLVLLDLRLLDVDSPSRGTGGPPRW